MTSHSFSLRELASFLWSHNDLPDLRLFSRLVLVLESLVTRLQDLPLALQRNALRGTRRWVNNSRISPSRLLSTARRKLLVDLLPFPELVIAHDSSEIDEHGRQCPEDAGPLRSSHARGYMTHWSVACGLDGLVHGAVDAWAWTRSWDLQKQDHHERDMSDKESSKWDRGIHRSERLLRAAGFRGILWHAEDREADIFEHLVHQKQLDRKVVVRGDLARKATVWVGKAKVDIESFFTNMPSKSTISHRVDSRVRSKSNGLTHKERNAKLEIRYANVLRCAPKRYSAKAPFGKGLPLGVVEIKEVETPEGVSPLHWILWTNHPIDSIEQAFKVKGIYQNRWGIEEFFFVCKTGCRLEEEHVDGLISFQRLLVVVMVAATHLLRWVSTARSQPEQAASELVEHETREAIKETCDFDRIPYPKKKWTIGDLVLLLARLGGYEVRRTTTYGWQAVWKGWARVQRHRAIVEHDRKRRGRRDPREEFP